MENKSNGSLLKKVIIVILLSLIFLTIIMAFSDIEEVIKHLRNANFFYIGLAMLVLLIYALIYPFKYISFTKVNKFDISTKDTYYIAASEFFYNSITPFQSGGQPFLIYKFNKYGVKPHQSSGMLITIFLVAQIAFMLFGTISVLFNLNYISNELSHLIHWIVIGFAVNIVILLFVICIGTSKKFRDFITWILKFLSKIRILNKFLEKRIPEFESFAIDAQKVFSKMVNSKLEMLLSVLIKMFCLFLLYSLPFFVFRAIGLDISFGRIFFISTMASIMMTMASWVFTPGAAGGVEFFFLAIFGAILNTSDSQIVAALLIWRVLTFYGLFIIGSIFYVITVKRTPSIIEENLILEE